MSNDEYWLEGKASDVASELEDYSKKWVSSSSNPVMQAWYRNSVAYFSNILEADHWNTALSFEGEQGELVKVVVPMARNIVRQLMAIISKQNLDFVSIARADGKDVRGVTRMANSLASQIVKDQKLDKKFQSYVELGLVYGASYTKATWRTDKGEPFESADLDEEAIAKGQKGIKYTGDVEISIHDVYDVYFDYSIKDWGDISWVVVRVQKNKWDLIAQHPELKDELLKVSTQEQTVSSYNAGSLSQSQDDLVDVYELFVRPSPSMLKGRMMMFCNSECIMYDGANKYDTIPVEQFKPENVFRMGHGHPFLSTILPSQEMLDHSFSAISTNEETLAVKNILAPRDGNVGSQEINGKNFILYTPGEHGEKPEQLDLGSSNPDTFKLIDVLGSHMNQLSNMNEAMRGQPLPGVTAGVAYATLTANALEFISQASKDYVQVAKDTVMHAINAYRRFGGETERMIFTADQSNATVTASKFVGTDLDPIQYVDLQVANPLMQTIAGRNELADSLASKGILKDLDGYVDIIEGKPLSSIVAKIRNQNDLIENENDAMMKGNEVPVLSTDGHPKHIYHHSSLLDDPIVRANGEYVKIVLEHITKHLELEKTTDPMLKIMATTGISPQLGIEAPPSESGEMPAATGDVMTPAEGPGAATNTNLPGGPAEPAQDLLGRG